VERCMDSGTHRIQMVTLLLGTKWHCITCQKMCLEQNVIISLQVPHSQCSLKESPKFLPNFRHKNNTIKVNFQVIFVFNIYLCNYGLALKGKNY
jgi:hypothetical protein